MEDEIFFVCHGTNAKGKLIVDFEGGHNEWLTAPQAKMKGDVFPNFDLEIDIVDSKNWLHEHRLRYKAQKF